MDTEIIPIFYACDDDFAKFTIVSIYSMKKNASRDYDYRIHILHTGITPAMQTQLSALTDANFTVCFCDVTDYLTSISDRLPLRDYYSKTTYYRFFIAELFPEYNKAIYIDGDTIVQGDISRLYHTDIKDAYVAACHDQVMVQEDVYGTYVEKVIGIPRHNCFTAGVLLINCDEFRLRFVLDKFIHYLGMYNFVVTQDEDYLNLICKDHVYWLDQSWNTQVFGQIAYPIEQANIVHYIMVNKPWHYKDCRHGEIFWQYAKETAVYADIQAVLAAYTEEERERDRISCENLRRLAITETNREDNFLNRLNSTKRSRDRVAVLQKIEAYEKEGRFDVDVEDDPPARTLMPDEIDYYRHSMYKKVKTKFAFMIARRFVYRLMDEKRLIIKEIKGIENFRALDSGAVITCNHFNAYDSFAIQFAYEAAKQPGRTFYRVIKEGNYTSFPGFYGFLMRHCNTLPLSSNMETLKKFMEATDSLLRDGHFVLIYPEQSMWWNYRKPKPLKKGAFVFACRNHVPVLPCFITMHDSDIVDADGFFVQEYTIHIEKPIYPDETLSQRENVKMLLDKNYTLWKRIYETEYDMPLTYTTENRAAEII